MSIIKSYAVGDGDMFTINHYSSNFTIIDCYLSNENKKAIISEIADQCKTKRITIFISTHPDEDHVRGLTDLGKEISILNFYCVKNDATKKDESADFKKYCEFRDSDKAFYISKGCTRKYMNTGDEDIKSSGIQILWPDVNNEFFKEALQVAKDGGSPNNISAVIKYSISDGPVVVWMGDLETEFMENIADEIDLPKANVLFAPHHGRTSGKVPQALIDKLDPDIIIIGEAPSEFLHYYSNFNTICQNSAEHITMELDTEKIRFYTSNKKHTVNYLTDERLAHPDYLGTWYI